MAQFFNCSPTSLDRKAWLPVRTAVAVLLTVIVFKFVFSCPCTAPAETVLHCWLYLLLPVGIVFFILALLDPRLLKACQCCGCRCCVGSGSRCSECCCCCAAGHSYRPASCCGEEGRYFCALIFGHVLNVFYAASLWIVVAFLDGDWYVCVRTAVENGTGEQIACKDLPTPQEAETLRKYNSESRIIGLILILGLSLLLTVISSLKTCWKPYYKSLYEVYVEQETSAMLEEKLREQAVERAKLITENAIKNIQNQPVSSGQGDARHVQYQPIGVADENVWRTISHPTFHLMGVRTHS
ncbi:uncharacterized protein LOC103037945 [Astyanax mexicanus]|uniref:uncharacterized protein LOC103037945 n=1 Tax=Astyanax mexicanus TaxID=7994 RepID=UPI0020CADCB3|nr:uncharacterized protein LOC103037945 [Astyanax mexicanus]